MVWRELLGVFKQLTRCHKRPSPAGGHAGAGVPEQEEPWWPGPSPVVSLTFHGLIHVSVMSRGMT